MALNNLLTSSNSSKVTSGAVRPVLARHYVGRVYPPVAARMVYTYRGNESLTLGYGNTFVVTSL